VFFQNLLPEGALRRHLAQIRRCAPDDHFELLAACGTDLPGAVYAFPAHLEREHVAGIVTQHQDALEMSVVADPMDEATSLSGVQPKLSLVEQGGRYVARTRDSAGHHIIAKLPTAEFPLLPQVEELSLRLAAAVGVNTCTATLAPVEDIDTELPFVLGGSRHFLAVRRFDRRNGQEHVHCEDFAQVLGVAPELKYTHAHASYGFMARVMRESMGLDAAQVQEFIRRIAVNELMGNYDAHLKNFGVTYVDGRTPQLSPAYDVVAYAAFLPGRGHALPFARGSRPRANLSPAVLRELCEEARFPETLASATVRDVVRKACATWPALIEASALLPEQKARLLRHFEAVPSVATWRRRSSRS
jgi:serine/threonine-protein kinase HipA